MADLTIRLRNALGYKLNDLVDIHVRRDHVYDEWWRRHDGKRAIKIPELVGDRYLVRVFPMRHRSVAKPVFVHDNTTLDVTCPVDPERVMAVRFAGYNALGTEFSRVMDASETERHPGLQGADLYGALRDIPKAGLLNLFAKMSRTEILDAPAWASVQSIYRIRGDRIFARVSSALYEDIQDEPAVESASGKLHEPDPGFKRIGSFKSHDSCGNLQLTFFQRENGPEEFRVDADINETSGLKHFFQVLGHGLTNGKTHPYDVHQILASHQGIVPAYSLDTT